MLLRLPEPVTTKAALRRPWQMLMRRRGMVATGLLCVPFHAAAMLAMPVVMGNAIDSLQEKDGLVNSLPRESALALHCQLLLALAVAETVFRYVSRRWLIDVSRHVEQDLKDEALAHIQRLPVPWFDKARTGDVVSRLTQDVELVRFVMGPLLLHGGSALCLLPAGIALMARLDLGVTFACATAFAVLTIALRLLMPRLHKWSKASQEAIGQISQRAQEDFAGIRVLQQFAFEERELAAMASKNRRYLGANLRLVRLRSLVHAITHSTSGLVLFAVLLFGGQSVIDGTLTVGELFQFTVCLGMMMFPLEILGWTIATMPRAVAAAKRVEEIFAEVTEPHSGAAVHGIDRLEVSGLTFTYLGAKKPALRDVSFTLLRGQKLGIVGPVGSGKSTLLALCLRFYEPPRGAMRIDGADLLDIAPSSLRALFAYAPQEPFLFSDTIENNVAFAQPNASAEDIARAVDESALSQDLDQLRDGMQTRVGERGVTLSGGQKQRVSLARALLADRQALMLDDTLSAVDPKTERRIVEGMRQRGGQRTRIVATHRLSAVADADLILVLEDGAVKERGTHHELLQLNGDYAAAWRRQTEAAALEGEGFA